MHLPPEVCPPLRYVRRGDREANRRTIKRALERTGGNVKAAARMLGVSRGTVNAMMVGARTRSGAQEGHRFKMS